MDCMFVGQATTSEASRPARSGPTVTRLTPLRPAAESWEESVKDGPEE
jgi:hypothetical protein